MLCWKFTLVLGSLAIGPTAGQDLCSSLSSTPIDLQSLTLSSPIMKQLLATINTQVTKEQLDEYVSQQSKIKSTVECRNLVEFLKSPSGDEVQAKGSKAFDVNPNVWIASIVSVVIISAVGLLGVAVVPLVNKSFYNDVIQFLVALAVGCLTGDAFLHLLPHAIASGHMHEEAPMSEIGGEEAGQSGEDGEREAALKGLVALSGVYFFYLAEKLVSSISEHRAEKHAEKEEQSRNLNVPKKSAEDMRRLSSYRGSISTGGQINSPFRRGSRLPINPDPRRRTSRAASLMNEDLLTTGLTAKANKAVDVLAAYAEESEDEEVTTGNFSLRIPVPSISVTHDEQKKQEHAPHVVDSSANDSVAPIEAKQQHGHSHKVPGSMASVAWMVIMGDGLHNFTDGMAIGVAFTASIAGGISTAVAVFCHELPHELGDFAVLLKTGMGIKQALFFNVVSSVLCLIGMIVGIGVGNIEAAASWIFALTAGTFVYIALVDMLPELSSFQVKAGQSRIVQLVIQNAGLLTGAGIMLVIALFEEQLKHLVTS